MTLLLKLSYYKVHTQGSIILYCDTLIQFTSLGHSSANIKALQKHYMHTDWLDKIFHNVPFVIIYHDAQAGEAKFTFMPTHMQSKNGGICRATNISGMVT